MSKSVKITGDKIADPEGIFLNCWRTDISSCLVIVNIKVYYQNSTCLRNTDENVSETTGVYESARNCYPGKRNVCMDHGLGKCFQSSAMPAVRYDPKRGGTKGYVESVISQRGSPNIIWGRTKLRVLRRRGPSFQRLFHDSGCLMQIIFFPSKLKKVVSIHDLNPLYSVCLSNSYTIKYFFGILCSLLDCSNCGYTRGKEYG